MFIEYIAQFASTREDAEAAINNYLASTGRYKARKYDRGYKYNKKLLRFVLFRNTFEPDIDVFSCNEKICIVFSRGIIDKIVTLIIYAALILFQIFLPVSIISSGQSVNFFCFIPMLMLLFFAAFSHLGFCFTVKKRTKQIAGSVGCVMVKPKIYKRQNSK